MRCTTSLVALALCHLATLTRAEDARSYLRALGEDSLRCTACTLVAAKMDDAIDSKLLKSWAGLTTEERIKKMRSAFSKRACPQIDDIQVAIMGETGKRKYVDFQEAMKQGGSLSEVNMGPEQKVQVRTLCELVAKGGMTELVGRLEAVLQPKGKKKKKAPRLADIRMQAEVCEGMLGTCQDDKDDDEEADADEDDREL